MIGKTISRYKITEKIGEGGMGSVWRAEDPLLGRDIALKFLPESLASSSDARKRFLREAKSASALRHPGIAAVFDAGEETGRIYIAFELVDGETVSERISRGPLAVGDACRVAFDAAEALDHAHARGVLHRDVTSRNIMIDREGKVIVVDFGLALPMGATRVTQEGSTVGTAPYLAPELVTGGDGDERSDVYGLGVVLYEALTGKLPFDADRVDSLFYLVVHTDAEAPSAKREGIPAELDRVVMKALAKDPEERYGSAREFAKDLYSYLEMASDRPPSDRWLTAPPPAPRARPASERLKRIATKPVTWVVVLAIAAAVVYGITKLTPEPAPDQAFASVAVLPFRNLSDSPGQSAWLAEGLGETLAAKLTSVTGVRVTPWFTSRNFGDMSRPLGEVAKDLNVEAVVVGTLRYFGERIACTITVVDSKSESQWWAGEYDEPMDDLFAVQQKIALGVATSLKGELSGSEERELTRPAARGVEAYEHYLRGSVAMQAGTREQVREALGFFERAIELDPELPDAYVGQGAGHRNLFYNEWGGMSDLREAETAFKRALKLDPTSIAARRGLIRTYGDLGRSRDALEQGREALRANPDGVENLLAMGEAFFFGGLADEAIALLQRAIQLDPVSEEGHYFLTLVYRYAGQYEAAIAAAEEYLTTFGENLEVYWYIAQAYHALGELDEAGLYYEHCLQSGRSRYNLDFNSRGLELALLYFDAGDDRRARMLLAECVASLERKLSLHPDHVRMRNDLAAAYGMLGDVAALEREHRKAGGIADPYGTVRIAAALGRSGEFKSAAQVLEAIVGAGNNMLNVTVGFVQLFPDGFWDHPDVQPALLAMTQLHDDLLARYGLAKEPQ